MEPTLAEALALLSTGIYVLTVRDGDRRHGMSSSWVTQVSGDPPLLLAAVDRRHFTHEVIQRTRWFALNVVRRDDRALEDYFYSPAARQPDNLFGLAYQNGRSGLPLLDGALASLECRVTADHPAGDHTLFVAAIAYTTIRGSEAPLTSQDLEYVYVGEVVARRR
jgi:flavin reductase (DIM6/NTAB) family NADH-FMN oxidoreductase RutF